MNVYDFDGTIYDGDSTLDFYFFCMKSKPIIITCIPHQIRAMIQYVLGKTDKTAFKEEFYCFLKKMDDVEGYVEKFWNVHEKKIKDWYRKKMCKSDVIISASPEFLLKPMCKRMLGQDVIASKVDKESGKYEGKNCYGEEKVRRFLETYADAKIDEFYSDSYSDKPIAELAMQFYIVKGETIRLDSLK